MKQIIWTTSSFIVPCMVIFLGFLAFFLYPRIYVNPGGGQVACQAGKVPTEHKEVMLPAIGDESTQSDLFEEGAAKDQYVLIRKDVPVSGSGLTAFCPELYKPGSSTCPHFSSIFTPEFPGEMVLYPRRGAGEHDYIDRVLKKKIGLWIWGEKIIFILHMQSRHAPKIYSLRPFPGEYVTGPNGEEPFERIISVDAYQEKSQYEEVINGKKTYSYEDIFQCDAQGALPMLSEKQIGDIIYSNPPLPFPSDRNSINSQIVIPNQNKSQSNQQLQLEWFVFEKSQGVWGSHCKPAVYLYPPQKMQVNVKVSPAGFLTYTDPQYDTKKGWTVDAYPDGNLINTSNSIPKAYPYLYFESKVRDEVIQKPTKGWVVKYEELNNLYQDILPKLGLNTQQTKDFSDYWNKALHPAPYYFVGVIDQANVDQIEKLDITPKPDTINRVRIYFERLDSPKTVEAPELSAVSFQPSAITADSGKFRVVEWGGMVKNDPDHPFTCSQ